MITFALSFLLVPALCWGYASLKEWSANEVLTASDLNANFTAVDNGVDSMNTNKLDKTAFSDSVNARIPNSFFLDWTRSWCDSVSTNDSMKVIITKHTLIGDMGGLFIVNSLGVTEQVQVLLDFDLPSKIAAIDSIKIPIWTEATNGDDYLAFSVFDDSTTTRFKAKLSANATDSVSATARTTKTAKISSPGIVGGRVRLKGVLNVKSDSAFVGVPIVYTTNR
jgi:hypothetical protein